MTLSRRDVLKTGAALGAALAAPALIRSAGAQPPVAAKHLMVVLNFGGWDTTYALDPKPGLTTIDAPEGEIRRFGELEIFDHPSRPEVTAFFERWAPLTAIVHGVQVRSFVHTDCVKRILTGSASETTPDIGAIAAFELGRNLPVPYLALGTQARSGPLASITGRTGTTNQLSALVDPEQAYANPRTFRPDPGFQASAAEQGYVRAYLEASAARVQALRGQHGYNRRRIEDFVGSLARAETLSNFATSGASLGERSYVPQLSAQVPLAVRAIKEGLSHTALLEMTGWDTHNDNSQQTMFNRDLYGSLGMLMSELEANELLDDTLVLVLSEMGRTPKLNGDMGKDHWPVTSSMLIGAGVRGGRAFGGTNDELNALSVDLQTGAVDPAGSQLQTENLLAGILETLGVDPEPHIPGAEPFRAFQAS